MDEPLSFSLKSESNELDISACSREEKIDPMHISINNSHNVNGKNSDDKDHNFMSDTKDKLKKLSDKDNPVECKNIVNIVNYDSSDNEDS